MADGLVIRIGADVTPAVQGLQQVEQRMRSTVAAGQSFGKGIDKSVQSLSKLPGSSNQATQSLINLSRVAQDAPYGFIGIANNLNPLLESFQRLKATTGTTGGALKEMGAALTGPAGLGLAVGVVSSLLVTFGDRILSIGGGVSKFAKLMEDAKEKVTEAYSTLGQLTSQIALAKQGLISKEAVLKLYNDTLGKSTGAVASLDEAERGLIKFGPAYVTMVMQKAIATAAFSKAAEKAFEQQVITEAFERDRSKVAGFVEDVLEKKINKRIKSLEKQKSLFADIAFEANKTAAEISKIFNLDFSESLKPEKPEKPKKPKSMSIKPEKVNLDFSLAKYGRLELPVGTAVLRMQELLLDKPKQLTFAETLQNSLTEKISKLVVTPNIKVAENKDLKAAAERRMALEKMEADVVINTLTPAFDSMFSALGKGENAFRAFGQAAIQALTQLIGKLITTTALASILGPLLGLSAGGVAGATGFKDWFKLLIGGARATGGPVTGGTSYMVGERGPEVFVPSVSGSIVPNNQLGSFSTGRSSSSGGSMRAIVRGQNILLAVARTTRGNSRLGLNGI